MQDEESCGTVNLITVKPLPAKVISRLRSGIAAPSFTQCVEELVLNAVDAGATCIAVRVDIPNFKIQVVDNGTGISKEDLNVVGERYCTSKCESLEGLVHSTYFGYRGEALASIAELSSVLEIVTRGNKSELTYSKLFSDGKPFNLFESEIKRPSHGTTVTVHNLFFNLPVRRKNYNVIIELEHVRRSIESIALSHHCVSLSLRDDSFGSKILQTHPTDSMVQAFGRLFGFQKSKCLKEVSKLHSSFHLTGFVGKDCHANKDLQFIYINKRLIIKSKLHSLVNHILGRSLLLRREYRKGSSFSANDRDLCDYTSPGKSGKDYPIFHLNIECPRTEYDITFDPKKTLVEFNDWEGVLRCVEDGLQEFLWRENLQHGVQKMEMRTKKASGRDTVCVQGSAQISSEVIEEEATIREGSKKALKIFEFNINTSICRNNLQSMHVRRSQSFEVTDLGSQSSGEEELEREVSRKMGESFLNSTKSEESPFVHFREDTRKTNTPSILLPKHDDKTEHVAELSSRYQKIQPGLSDAPLPVSGEMTMEPLVEDLSLNIEANGIQEGVSDPLPHSREDAQIGEVVEEADGMTASQCIAAVKDELHDNGMYKCKESEIQLEENLIPEIPFVSSDGCQESSESINLWFPSCASTFRFQEGTERTCKDASAFKGVQSRNVTCDQNRKDGQAETQGESSFISKKLQNIKDKSVHKKEPLKSSEVALYGSLQSLGDDDVIVITSSDDASNGKFPSEDDHIAKSGNDVVKDRYKISDMKLQVTCNSSQSIEDAQNNFTTYSYSRTEGEIPQQDFGTPENDENNKGKSERNATHDIAWVQNDRPSFNDAEKGSSPLSPEMEMAVTPDNSDMNRKLDVISEAEATSDCQKDGQPVLSQKNGQSALCQTDNQPILSTLQKFKQSLISSPTPFHSCKISQTLCSFKKRGLKRSIESSSSDSGEQNGLGQRSTKSGWFPAKSLPDKKDFREGASLSKKLALKRASVRQYLVEEQAEKSQKHLSNKEEKCGKSKSNIGVQSSFPDVSCPKMLKSSPLSLVKQNQDQNTKPSEKQGGKDGPAESLGILRTKENRLVINNRIVKKLKRFEMESAAINNRQDISESRCSFFQDKMKAHKQERGTGHTIETPEQLSETKEKFVVDHTSELQPGKAPISVGCPSVKHVEVYASESTDEHNESDLNYNREENESSSAVSLSSKKVDSSMQSKGKGQSRQFVSSSSFICPAQDILPKKLLGGEDSYSLRRLQRSYDDDDAFESFDNECAGDLVPFKRLHQNAADDNVSVFQDKQWKRKCDNEKHMVSQMDTDSSSNLSEVGQAQLVSTSSFLHSDTGDNSRVHTRPNVSYSGLQPLFSYSSHNSTMLPEARVANMDSSEHRLKPVQDFEMFLSQSKNDWNSLETFTQPFNVSTNNFSSPSNREESVEANAKSAESSHDAEDGVLWRRDSNFIKRIHQGKKDSHCSVIVDDFDEDDSFNLNKCRSSCSDIDFNKGRSSGSGHELNKDRSSVAGHDFNKDVPIEAGLGLNMGSCGGSGHDLNKNGSSESSHELNKNRSSVAGHGLKIDSLSGSGHNFTKDRSSVAGHCLNIDRSSMAGHDFNKDIPIEAGLGLNMDSCGGSEHNLNKNGSSESSHELNKDRSNGFGHELNKDRSSESGHDFNKDRTGVVGHGLNMDSLSESGHDFTKDNSSGSGQELNKDKSIVSGHDLNKNGCSGSGHEVKDRSSGSSHDFDKDRSSVTGHDLNVDSSSGSDHKLNKGRVIMSGHDLNRNRSSGPGHELNKDRSCGSGHELNKGRSIVSGHDLNKNRSSESCLELNKDRSSGYGLDLNKDKSCDSGPDFNKNSSSGPGHELHEDRSGGSSHDFNTDRSSLAVHDLNMDSSSGSGDSSITRTLNKTMVSPHFTFKKFDRLKLKRLYKSRGSIAGLLPKETEEDRLQVSERVAYDEKSQEIEIASPEQKRKEEFEGSFHPKDRSPVREVESWVGGRNGREMSCMNKQLEDESLNIHLSDRSKVSKTFTDILNCTSATNLGNKGQVSSLHFQGSTPLVQICDKETGLPNENVDKTEPVRYGNSAGISRHVSPFHTKTTDGNLTGDGLQVKAMRQNELAMYEMSARVGCSITPTCIRRDDIRRNTSEMLGIRRTKMKSLGVNTQIKEAEGTQKVAKLAEKIEKDSTRTKCNEIHNEKMNNNEFENNTEIPDVSGNQEFSPYMSTETTSLDVIPETEGEQVYHLTDHGSVLAEPYVDPVGARVSLDPDDTWHDLCAKEEVDMKETMIERQGTSDVYMSNANYNADGVTDNSVDMIDSRTTNTSERTSNKSDLASNTSDITSNTSDRTSNTSDLTRNEANLNINTTEMTSIVSNEADLTSHLTEMTSSTPDSTSHAHFMTSNVDKIRKSEVFTTNNEAEVTSNLRYMTNSICNTNAEIVPKVSITSSHKGDAKESNSSNDVQTLLQSDVDSTASAGNETSSANSGILGAVDIDGDWIKVFDQQRGRIMLVNRHSGNCREVTNEDISEDANSADLSKVENTVKFCRQPFLSLDTAAVLPKMLSSEKAEEVPKAAGTNCDGKFHDLLNKYFDSTVREETSKWRNGVPPPTDDTEDAIFSLFDQWKNPLFNTAEVKITNTQFNKKLAGWVKVHNSLNPCKFTKDMLSDTKVVGQVDDKFIACVINTSRESRSGTEHLVLIDQHAAHERVRLEQLTAEAYQRVESSSGDEDSCSCMQGDLRSSKIIPPLKISLAPSQNRLARAFHEKFVRFGVSLQFTEDAEIVEVTSLPSCIIEREASERKKRKRSVAMELAESLVRDCLQRIQDTKAMGSSLPKTIIKVLNSQACHGAIKFGDPMDANDMESLIGQLSSCDLPFQCAHGRPSIMPLLDLTHLRKHLASTECQRPAPNLKVLSTAKFSQDL